MDKYSKNPYIERPEQAYYNPHQQQQYTQPPLYSEPQSYQMPEAYPQHQYQNGPQMVYVQPQSRPSKERRKESSCLPCACLAACCWICCWPCLCCF
ncbi:hypothetical protein BYT27DRAFT_6464231 [Phlegmacium glaucopus]|nr:hypothetical protein BYT27DRAFT_6464231 [Phlegmacium glaucopus]